MPLPVSPGRTPKIRRDFSQLRKKFLFVGVERIPGEHEVTRVRHVCRHWIEWGQLCTLWQGGLGDHAREDSLPVNFVAVVELALVQYGEQMAKALLFLRYG
jgi:hypothetical protein